MAKCQLSIPSQAPSSFWKSSGPQNLCLSAGSMYSAIDAISRIRELMPIEVGPRIIVTEHVFRRMERAERAGWSDAGLCYVLARLPDSVYG